MTALAGSPVCWRRSVAGAAFGGVSLEQREVARSGLRPLSPGDRTHRTVSRAARASPGIPRRWTIGVVSALAASACLIPLFAYRPRRLGTDPGPDRGQRRRPHARDTSGRRIPAAYASRPGDRADPRVDSLSGPLLAQAVVGTPFADRRVAPRHPQPRLRDLVDDPRHAVS